MTQEKKSGIYCFVINDKFAYVGQSIDLNTRLSSHKRKIEENRHPNVENIEINSITYNVLEYCLKKELNIKESYYATELSKKYTLLNKVYCGNSKKWEKLFEIDSNVSCNILNIGGEMIIGEYHIQRKGNMFSISDLLKFVKENSDINVNIHDIVSSHRFIERIKCVYDIEINRKNAIKEMKYKDLWLTIGRGNKRIVYCDIIVFFTLMYEISPRLCVSYILALQNGVVRDLKY